MGDKTVVSTDTAVALIRECIANGGDDHDIEEILWRTDMRFPPKDPLRIDQLSGGDLTKKGSVSYEECAKRYPMALHIIRRTAYDYGYCIAVHGSMTRDLDLLATPWVEDARPTIELVRALEHAVGGFVVNRRGSGVQHGSTKPHGRMAWAIHLGAGPHIDLSVVPVIGSLDTPEQKSDFDLFYEQCIEKAAVNDSTRVELLYDAYCHWLRQQVASMQPRPMVLFLHYLGSRECEMYGSRVGGVKLKKAARPPLTSRDKRAIVRSLSSAHIFSGVGDNVEWQGCLRDDCTVDCTDMYCARYAATQQSPENNPTKKVNDNG